MLLAINSGNTNVVFAVYDGDALRASWRAATNPKRTADEYAVWLTQLMALAGLARSRHRRDDHRQRRARGGVQPDRAVPALFQQRAAGRRPAELQARHRHRCRHAAAECRRRPDRQRGRGAGPLPGAADGRRFRHLDQFRHCRQGRQLLRRRPGAGTEPVGAGLGDGGGAIAARLDRASADRGRPQHHPGHAIRRVLGLCRADRGAGAAHPRGARRGDGGRRDRRAGAAVCQRDRCHRQGRSRSDVVGAAPDLSKKQPTNERLPRCQLSVAVRRRRPERAAVSWRSAAPTRSG